MHHQLVHAIYVPSKYLFAILHDFVTTADVPTSHNLLIFLINQQLTYITLHLVLLNLPISKRHTFNRS